MASYELQDFTDLSKPQINKTENVIINVKHCFILNGKELPIHQLTLADVFCDVIIGF